MREISATFTSRPDASLIATSARAPAGARLLIVMAPISIKAAARSVRAAMGPGPLFRENELAVGGDAQAVVLPVVDEDRLAAAGQQLGDDDAYRTLRLGVCGRRGRCGLVILGVDQRCLLHQGACWMRRLAVTLGRLGVAPPGRGDFSVSLFV